MTFEGLQNITSMALLGLIWTVQMVHYPSFKYVSPDIFEAFHNFHTRAIGYVVAPLMLAELLAAIWLTVPTNGDTRQWILLVITLLIWLSTGLIQVPIHRKLAHGKSDQLITRLVATNWVRTLLWTLKAALIAYWGLL